MPITPHQRRLRRNHLGASDTPAVLGLSPWATANDIYWSKVGPETDDEPTEAMATGNRLEGPLVEFASERLGVRVVRNQYRVADDGVFSATLDAQVAERPEAVEAKYVGPQGRDLWGDDGTADVPDHVYAQVQHQMHVADLERVWVAAALAGYRLEWRLYCVARYEPAIAEIVRRGLAFWNEHVLARVPPDNGPPPMEVLRAMRRDRNEIALPDEAVEALAEYERAKAAGKAAEEEASQSQRLLLDMLGEATDGRLPDGRLVTYRPQSRKDIDRKRLQAEHPDIAAAVARDVTFSVFRVTK